MKHTVRLISLLLTLAMLLSLCACRSSSAQPEPSPTPSTSVEPEPEPEPSGEPKAIPLSDGAKIGELSYGRELYRYLGQEVSRLYYYYIPSTYQEGEKLPLMFSLHGSGSNATISRLETNWVKYAEQERFIVVFPESVYIHKDGTLSSEGKSYLETKQSDYSYMRWNAASTDPVAGYGVNDVKNISDLIDIFVDEGYVDPARVYSSGMSHGAFLSLRLALEIPEKIAGVGIVSALLCTEYIYKKLPQGPKVVFINGTEDSVVPITGMVYDFDKDGVFEYTWALSQEDSVAWFLDQYGMENDPGFSTLPDTAPDDGTTISRYEYRDEQGDVKVVRYVVDGGGHTWPGGNIDYGSFGRSSKDAQGAELIWAELKDVKNTFQGKD